MAEASVAAKFGSCRGKCRRFVCAKECTVHPNYKASLIKAKDRIRFY